MTRFVHPLGGSSSIGASVTVSSPTEAIRTFGSGASDARRSAPSSARAWISFANYHPPPAQAAAIRRTCQESSGYRLLVA
jgi:hypothetical protein